MKRNLAVLSFAVLGVASCRKNVDSVATSITNKAAATKTAGFVKYTIPKGEQYCDLSTYKAVNIQQLSFIVKFDSSAIYTTASASNQTDINKLLGFSDNNSPHHEYSARFGWRWSNNALRLFAYIYNNSVMSFKELGTIEIGTENNCSIKVMGDSYAFTLNRKETSMPRESTTTNAQGYALYPYFGGDEAAPHSISVWIREL